MRNTPISTTLHCFSPPIMIATFALEIGLAIYAIWRYKLNATARLIVIALITLATFQLAEYFVCEGLGLSSNTWSRIGFVAITALPPLGLHLLYRIKEDQSRTLVATAYATMVGFMSYFMFSSTAFSGYVCTGNYVIFQIGTAATLYSMYYYGWLFIALLFGIMWLQNTKPTTKQYKAVSGLLVGYLVFLVPTGIVNSINSQTISGIPSIMCGFAVLFALILALYILPKITTKRHI